MLKATEKIFKALADANRIRILNMLQSKPLCVCEITSILGLATSTVSKHLSILRGAGLITDRKDSKWVNYEIERHPQNPEALAIISLIHRMLDKDETVRIPQKGRPGRPKPDLCNRIHRGRNSINCKENRGMDWKTERKTLFWILTTFF